MVAVRQLAVGLCMFVMHVFYTCDGVFPDAEIVRRYGDSVRHPQDRTLYGNNVPVLKMMKRLVRGFRRGYIPSITLVFYATQSVQVRWYKHADPIQFSNSAVRSMIPMKDGNSCSISSLKAGDVVATTLTLQQWRTREKHDYETIITTEDGTMQYQLSTKVSQVIPSGGLLDVINSPEWMAVPPPHITFTPGQPLFVHCQVFVPNEADTVHFINELTMYRVLIVNGIDASDSLITFDSVIAIHKESQVIAEETPGASNKLKTFATGSRTQLSHLHAIYQLQLETRTATSNFSGIYQCALERKFDKLFVISKVTRADMPSVFPPAPVIELIHCVGRPANEQVRKVILQQGKDTCIRCRGASYPAPIIRVIDPEGKELAESRHVTVDSYINVADAGVHEMIYTFHKPNDSHPKIGVYVCEVSNSNGQKAEIRFEVEYRPNNT